MMIQDGLLHLFMFQHMTYSGTKAKRVKPYGGPQLQIGNDIHPTPE